MNGNNKEAEMKIFNEFCQIMEWNYDYFSHTETPDFVSEDEEFGVELTEYHEDQGWVVDEEKETSYRERESIKHEIVKIAEQKCLSRLNFLVEVDIFFRDIEWKEDKDFNYRLKNKDCIAEEISRFVSKKAKSLKSNKKDCRDRLIFRDIFHFNDKDLPCHLRELVGISFIGIEILDEGELFMGWEVKEFNICTIDTDAVAAHIKKKEKKIENYRKQATRNHLIIHSSPAPGPVPIGEEPGFAVTTGIDARELLKVEFTSRFERVYYFECHYKDIYLMENRRFKKIT